MAKVKKLQVPIHVTFHEGKPLMPVMGKEGSAAYDVVTPEDIVLLPNTYQTIDTGLVVDIPEGYFYLVLPRSSSRKKNIRISNTAGVVDPSFRGPNDRLSVRVERGSPRKKLVSVLGPNEKSAFSENVETIELDGKTYVYVEEELPPLVYKAGERFCQILFLPRTEVEFVQEHIDHFRQYEDRGGFGSSGDS